MVIRLRTCYIGRNQSMEYPFAKVFTSILRKNTIVIF